MMKSLCGEEFPNDGAHWFEHLPLCHICASAWVKKSIDEMNRLKLQVNDLRRLMGPYSTVEIALKAQERTNRQNAEYRKALEEIGRVAEDVGEDINHVWLLGLLRETLADKREPEPPKIERGWSLDENGGTHVQHFRNGEWCGRFVGTKCGGCGMEVR